MERLERLLLRHGARAGWMALALWAAVFAGVVAGLWRPQGAWLVFGAITVVLVIVLRQWVLSLRERFIREAPLPRFLQRKLREKHPHLSTKDCELVERGLRQFFLACMRSRRQFVAMPSQVVDDLWHEFILHTQAYRQWCNDALGFFLHHTPAEALGGKAKHNDGLRRAWYWACKEESIHPKSPSRLPLLFALDAKLHIPNGFHYVANCAGLQPVGHGDASGASSPYCGTDFADGSYSGSSADFGGAESSSGSDGGSSSSDGDGGSGGDGGGGCGGGGGD